VKKEYLPERHFPVVDSFSDAPQDDHTHIYQKHLEQKYKTKKAPSFGLVPELLALS